MIYVAAGSVVFFGIFAYVMFMIFLPEWVGITGKTALKNEQSHLGQTDDQLKVSPASVSASESTPANDPSKKNEES